jgi:hypothetical protein
MKIAICFSGMVRTSNYATPNLLKYLGDLFPNIDFFMHTWNITQHKQYAIGAMALLSNNYKKCSVESSYPIVCNMVNDYKNFKKIKIEEFSNECEIYNSFPLWYSWAQSIKLKEEYENEYNFKYDVVLKMRPDMIFPEGSTLHKEIDNFLNNPELFYVMGGNESRLNDVYFLSSSDNMNIATKIIDNPLPWQENELNIHLLKNNINGEESVKDFTGLFVAIGHLPRSELVVGQVELNSDGYVQVEGRSTKTKIPGVFACGDLVDYTYRQAITAAGSGCQAALDAERFLAGH